MQIKQVMEEFNSKITGSSTASPIDLQRETQLTLSRSRYPFASPAFGSPTSDPLDMDPTLIRNSRASAAAGLVPSSVDVFGSPAIDSGKFHQLLLHHRHQHTKLSFSRGSSSSPLSAIENLMTPPSRSPPMFSTPVKVEEDVLVMDGILVGSLQGARSRSASDSGSLSGNSLYKTDICRSWEDFGSCRYGSKCQFAHGKEDMRPTRNSNKNKSEAQVCKSFSTTAGSCTYGTKCRFIHHGAAAAETNPTIMAEQESSTVDWSPADDNIEVRLPTLSTEESPAREVVNAYINDVLYGPRRTRRLPVFSEFCPE